MTATAKRRRRKQETDRGAATVEAAIGLATLLLAMSMVLYALSAAADQVRCVDAAREAARLTARGDGDQAKEAAARIAPPGAEVDIDVDGERVHVTIHASSPDDLLPVVHLHAEAFAVREPGG